MPFRQQPGIPGKKPLGELFWREPIGKVRKRLSCPVEQDPFDHPGESPFERRKAAFPLLKRFGVFEHTLLEFLEQGGEILVGITPGLDLAEKRLEAVFPGQAGFERGVLEQQGRSEVGKQNRKKQKSNEDHLPPEIRERAGISAHGSNRGVHPFDEPDLGRHPGIDHLQALAADLSEQEVGFLI